MHMSRQNHTYTTNTQIPQPTEYPKRAPNNNCKVNQNKTSSIK